MASFAPRWIAAAAVAGLVVGVGVGSFFQSGVRVSRLRQPATLGATPGPAAIGAPIERPEATAADPANAANAGTSAPSDTNEEFLSELELALDRPRTHELLALDELTPRVRELPVSNRIR